MNNKAFTLIELLVVVVILGILFGMAAAHYQKVVFMTRSNQLKALVMNIARGEENYKVRFGSYTMNIHALDPSYAAYGKKNVPGSGKRSGFGTKDWTVYLYEGANDMNIVGYLDKGPYPMCGFWYSLKQPEGSKNPARELMCYERDEGSKTPDGSFCTDIWGGTLVSKNSTQRLYRMP